MNKPKFKLLPRYKHMAYGWSSSMNWLYTSGKELRPERCNQCGLPAKGIIHVGLYAVPVCDSHLKQSIVRPFRAKWGESAARFTQDRFERDMKRVELILHTVAPGLLFIRELQFKKKAKPF